MNEQMDVNDDAKSSSSKNLVMCWWLLVPSGPGPPGQIRVGPSRHQFSRPFYLVPVLVVPAWPIPGKLRVEPGRVLGLQYPPRLSLSPPISRLGSQIMSFSYHIIYHNLLMMIIYS